MKVTTTNGRRINLITNDTLTLAFPGMIESTPAQLRLKICEKSLERIAETSRDGNERSKAGKALELTVWEAQAEAETEILAGGTYQL